MTQGLSSKLFIHGLPAEAVKGAVTAGRKNTPPDLLKHT
jgi:hypothetical protein